MCIRDSRNTRRKSYNMFSQMGMTKAGIRKMYITENAFILIPAGIIGILLALAVGHFTGQALEAKSGYEFYRVNTVSYTHLDVYKRQIYNRQGSNACRYRK